MTPFLERSLDCTSRRCSERLNKSRAHWCPPCRAFTPLLRRAYLDAVKKGLNFEVVFCSFDMSAADFEEYYGSMPWLAIPFEKKSLRNELSDRYGVEGIPTLLLLDETGVYNAEGRMSVTKNPSGFPWRE